jgi:hypothetical protein
MVQVTRSGGTGKAEAAKLQDAGISLKQCPRKMSGRKRLGSSTQREPGGETGTVFADAFFDLLALTSEASRAAKYAFQRNPFSKATRNVITVAASILVKLELFSRNDATSGMKTIGDASAA